MDREDGTTPFAEAAKITGWGTFGVTVIEGADEDREQGLVLDENQHVRCFVGTAQGSSLKLADRSVSRRHLELQITRQGLLVRDLESTNGTWVDGVRVETAYAKDMSTLRLGATTLRVRALPSAEAPIPTGPVRLGRFVGQSSVARKISDVAKRLAETNVPFLIEGPSGIGKDTIAEAIHGASERKDQPFVVFTQVEPSEISVAFEQALVDAGAGTLVIEEPSLLSKGLQTKIASVIEKSGGPRVILTTRHDFDADREHGRVVEALHAKVAGARLDLPPLKGRDEDVRLIAEELWRRLASSDAPADLLEGTAGNEWAGNVRELEQWVTRRYLRGEVSSPEKSDEPKANAPAAARERLTVSIAIEGDELFSAAREKMLDEFLNAFTERMLARHDNNVTHAAAASGLARRYFQLLRARRKAAAVRG